MEYRYRIMEMNGLFGITNDFITQLSFSLNYKEKQNKNKNICKKICYIQPKAISTLSVNFSSENI